MKVQLEFELPDGLFASFVTKEYLESRIKEVLENVPTDPSLDDCKAGPEIKTIKQLSPKKIQVNFYGEDIFEIKYILTKGGKLIQDGVFVPKNDLPIIDLNDSLTTGDYVLEFKATLCNGGSKKDFTVK